MATSPRLDIQALSGYTDLVVSRIQQENYNKMIGQLDCIVQHTCQQFDLNTPPTLVFGECYKVGSSPTGAWASAAAADKIAMGVYSAFDGSGEPTTLIWDYITPDDGMILYDQNGGDLLVCTTIGSDTWEIIPRQGTTITPLTDSTTGTGGGTLSAVTDTTSSDQSSTINNNFASLNDKLDEIVTSLENAGFLA